MSVQAQVLNLLQELKSKLGLTYFFISHNLNVVYQVSDRVGVMYLGKMVEIASYDRLYEKRYHPYTEALLSAIPQVNQEEQQERIPPERGGPESLGSALRLQVPYRCPKACERCRLEEPALREIAPGHLVACHLYDGAQERKEDFICDDFICGDFVYGDFIYGDTAEYWRLNRFKEV